MFLNPSDRCKFTPDFKEVLALDSSWLHFQEERFRILLRVIELRAGGSSFERFVFSVHLAEFGGAPLSRTRLSTMEEIDRLLSTIELDEYTIKEPKRHLSLEVFSGCDL